MENINECPRTLLRVINRNFFIKTCVFNAWEIELFHFF